MRLFTLLLVFGVSVNACSKSTNQQTASGAALPTLSGTEIAAQDGSGRVFVMHLSGHAAGGMLHDFIAQSTGYFDNPPRLSHAMRNRADTHAQVAFQGSVHDKPVRGLLLVSAGDARGLMAIDYSDRIATSFNALMEKSGQGRLVPRPRGSVQLSARAQSEPLHSTTLPGNFGTISIAQGWRIAPAQFGGVGVNGPGGAQLSLGGRLNLTTPQMARQNPGALYVTSMDPVRAMQEVTAQVAQRAQKQLQVQILNVERVSIPQGPAAFVRYRLVSQGRAMDGFGISVLTQVGPAQIISSGSGFVAPPAVFTRLLPTALAMWSSWSTGSPIVQRRLRQMMPNSGGTSGADMSGRENDTVADGYPERGASIHDEPQVSGGLPTAITGAGVTQGGHAAGDAEAQRQTEGAVDGFDEYIRGTTMLEHTEADGTRTREEVYQDIGTEVAGQFPDEYREVPNRELAPDANGNYPAPGEGGNPGWNNPNESGGGGLETPTDGGGYPTIDAGGGGYSAPDAGGGGYTPAAPEPAPMPEPASTNAE